jgi:large subunit ribosomal protein L10
MAHVASWKKDIVNEIVADIQQYPVVAIVDMQEIPAPQIQSMRAGMRQHAKIKMTKNNLMLLALDQAASVRPGVEKLKEYVGGQCAIVTTDINAFQLFKKLKATSTPAPAKAGQTAPFDIVVPEGPTPFGPGPIIGELQKLGLPAQIMNGKITIKKETVVVHEGEVISPELASMLPKLEILPMEVGMNARAIYGDGIIYSREVLDIPDDYYPTMFATAARDALALAVEIAYPAKETMPALIAKAYRSAVALSVEAAIPTKETIGALFAKADRQMLALASASGFTNDDIAARLASAPAAASAAAEPADDKKAEQKAEEEKSEEETEEEVSAGLGALFG